VDVPPLVPTQSNQADGQAGRLGVGLLSPTPNSPIEQCVGGLGSRRAEQEFLGADGSHGSEKGSIGLVSQDDDRFDRLAGQLGPDDDGRHQLSVRMA
jgi:hypothetical protein